MAKLALLGGAPIRTKLFPAYNTIGAEEKAAVQHVLDSGNLSQFLGAWGPDFLGGPTVRRFEEEWAAAIGVKRAITVNSNTSGLFASMGALGVGPGDEVIVSPYTMSASAIAPMVYGAVPVFADVDPQTFCLDPKSIEARISPRTKAIIVVHIMGHPADMDPIMALARRHGIRVVEDAAQAPMGKYKGRFVGGIGDIGVFSLNYHKHIHTGEGGVITTNDPELARRLELVRNHGETSVEALGDPKLTGIVGFNYRMTEIEAAIGSEQLRKLPTLLEARIQNVKFLVEGLRKLPGLTPQELPLDSSVHTFYVHAIKVDTRALGVSRDRLVAALRAELPSAILRETTPLLGGGYVRPLYLQPIYQQRASLCSFNCPRYEGGRVEYGRGLCPVAERLHFEELLTHELMRPGMTRDDLADVLRGFEKVIENVAELRDESA